MAVQTIVTVMFPWLSCGATKEEIEIQKDGVVAKS